MGFNYFVFPIGVWQVEVQEKAEILHEDITKHVRIPDSMLSEHLSLFHYWIENF